MSSTTATANIATISVASLLLGQGFLTGIFSESGFFQFQGDSSAFDALFGFYAFVLLLSEVGWRILSWDIDVWTFPLLMVAIRIVFKYFSSEINAPSRGIQMQTGVTFRPVSVFNCILGTFRRPAKSIILLVSWFAFGVQLPFSIGIIGGKRYVGFFENVLPCGAQGPRHHRDTVKLPCNDFKAGGKSFIGRLVYSSNTKYVILKDYEFYFLETKEPICVKALPSPIVYSKNDPNLCKSEGDGAEKNPDKG